MSVGDFLTSDVDIDISFSSLDIGTSSRVEECPELLLFPRLSCFSGLLAMTNSGSALNCRWCLRRMMNQKSTKDMMRIAATGTTMAGIKVPKLLDEESLLAAVEVAAGADEDLVDEVEARAALALDSDACREENCAESVTRMTSVWVVTNVVTGCTIVSCIVLVNEVKSVPPSVAMTVFVVAPAWPGPVMIVVS